MRKNRIKEKLKKNMPVIGTFQGFSSTDLTEMCGYSGYDFVILDTEHGPMTAESCIPMICAAERTNIVPIIRVSENEKNYILKALDVGAMGIVFPMINSVKDAKKAIFLTRYIQRADETRSEFRGIVDVSRASAYGIPHDLKTHISTSNQEIIIITQFETKEAIENLDEVLKLPEIDVVLIGSIDLSQSMGYPGEVKHPLVQKVIKEAIEKIIKAGKSPGIVLSSPDAIKGWLDMGVKFLIYHQTYMIRDVMLSYLSAFHRLIEP